MLASEFVLAPELEHKPESWSGIWLAITAAFHFDFVQEPYMTVLNCIIWTPYIMSVWIWVAMSISQIVEFQFYFESWFQRSTKMVSMYIRPWSELWVWFICSATQAFLWHFETCLCAGEMVANLICTCNWDCMCCLYSYPQNCTDLYILFIYTYSNLPVWALNSWWLWEKSFGLQSSLFCLVSRTCSWI